MKREKKRTQGEFTQTFKREPAANELSKRQKKAEERGKEKTRLVGAAWKHQTSQPSRGGGMGVKQGLWG